MISYRGSPISVLFQIICLSDTDSSESDSSDSESDDSDYETKSSSGSLSPTEVVKKAPAGMAPPKPGMVLVKRKRAKIDIEEEKAKKQKMEKLKMLEMTKGNLRRVWVFNPAGQNCDNFVTDSHSYLNILK